MVDNLPSAFPINCPRCLKPDGWPFRAATIPQINAVQLDIRCRDCGHQWADELSGRILPSPTFVSPVILRPKADRRHTRR